jgi:hypothetical protein
VESDKINFCGMSLHYCQIFDVAVLYNFHGHLLIGVIDFTIV